MVALDGAWQGWPATERCNIGCNEEVHQHPTMEVHVEDHDGASFAMEHGNDGWRFATKRGNGNDDREVREGGGSTVEVWRRWEGSKAGAGAKLVIL